MTAPRTDPQSTVPVEPPDPVEELAAVLGETLRANALRLTADRGGYVGGGQPHATLESDPYAVEAIARGLLARQVAEPSRVRLAATLRMSVGGPVPVLDAARASQPIMATALIENVAFAIGGAFTAAEVDAIARAYAAGHRDGVGCGVESAGFGFVECEHVGRLAALPVREDEPTGIDGALKTIRDLCDMDLEEQRAEFGSEQRVMHVVIPAVVNDALGVEPMSEGLRRVLFRLFSYIGEASHVR